MELLLNFLALFTESAPWLLMGLFLAGVMKYLLPVGLLERHMAKDDLRSVTKAALIGAPLPLCSCGVIPAAVGLRRAGASPSATVSFLIATPETGVDSIAISYALLGPFMAVIRPISAIASAITAGILVMFAPKKTAIEAPKSSSTHAKKSCCGSNKNSEKEQRNSPLSATQIMAGIWHFSTGKLLQDITKWLLIGLVLAAGVKTWVPTEFLTQWGDGFVAMLAMALIGIPMYICASASTPLAAGFLAAGVSPGAVLVFMLAGPATNLATMGMIKQELGKSVMLIYVATILVTSILFGYLTNGLVSEFNFTVHTVAASGHEMSHSWLYIAAAGLLTGLIVKNTLSDIIQRRKTTLASP